MTGRSLRDVLLPDPERPRCLGVLLVAVTYIALRAVGHGGPAFGVGVPGSTWETTIAASAIGAILVGLTGRRDALKRVALDGSTVAAVGTVLASSALVASFIAETTTNILANGEPVGQVLFTLLVALSAWVPLLGICLACALVVGPLAIVVAQLRDPLG